MNSLSNLIPNMSMHFLYCLLEHDYENGVKIIKTITRTPPENSGIFLSAFASALDGYFCRLEADLKGYDKIRYQALEDLKNPYEEDVEELN